MMFGSGEITSRFMMKVLCETAYKANDKQDVL